MPCRCDLVHKAIGLAHDLLESEFVEGRGLRPRSELIESEQFQVFGYDELAARDKTNLDLVWLKDDSLEGAADLPAPGVLAREIAEELEASLGEIEAIVAALSGDN